MLENNQIFRLLDIAGLACHKGLVLKARTIYEGVLADKPGHVPALIGLAYSHLTVNEFSEAEDILRNQVLVDHPNDPDALAYLGLALALADRKDEAREILASVPAKAVTARSLADKLIEQL